MIHGITGNSILSHTSYLGRPPRPSQMIIVREHMMCVGILTMPACVVCVRILTMPASVVCVRILTMPASVVCARILTKPDFITYGCVSLLTINYCGNKFTLMCFFTERRGQADHHKLSYILIQRQF